MISGFPLPTRYEPTTTAFASGGMSHAIVCRDTHLDRQVLVKALKPGTDPARILDELSALSAIRSKHVVQVFDVVKDGSGTVVAIVEELLVGPDLVGMPPPADLNEFLRCAYAVASGVCDIHDFGIVHRDIKPNNMKFDADGCLKIFDFGLARFKGKNASTVSIIGTPGFMAPELGAIAADGSIPFTTAIDAFAFGSTILHVVLGGLPACMSGFPSHIGAGVTFAAAPFPMPAELVGLLDSCFHSNPLDRPDICEVRRILAKYILRDRHKALLVANGQEHVLDAKVKSVGIGSALLGKFNLRYDGLDFYIDYVSGDVYLNNKAIKITTLLPGSCVVVVGSPDKGMGRLSVSIDVSHPEVVL